VRPLIVVCIALFVSSIDVSAQSLSVSAVAMSADHELLGDPLIGASVGIRFATHSGSKSLRLDVERLTGNAERFGVPCGGFIAPDTCPQESVRDDARLSSATAGMGFRLFARRHAAVAVTADLGVARIVVKTRGLSTGKTLNADKNMWSGLIGAEGTWTPLMRVPLVLHFGAGVGGLMPLRPEQVADGYTPFNRTIALSRARLGIAFQL